MLPIAVASRRLPALQPGEEPRCFDVVEVDRHADSVAGQRQPSSRYCREASGPSSLPRVFGQGTERVFPPDPLALRGLPAAEAIARAEAAGFHVRRFDVGDGMAMTLDYDSGRLTVVINRAGVVASASIG